MKEASFYRKLDQGKVQCLLCPHQCILGEGQTGLCRGKQNQDGKLLAINYGQLVSISLDPIEKKPLYHFYPGKTILSTGPNGCNFNCQFCQNWQISQEKVPTRMVYPENLVALTLDENSLGIAYTYTEPIIWFEYILDTAQLAHEKGLKNVLVSNGFINPEPLAKLLPFIDAINIDLKSINPAFYLKYCNGKLEPVLESIRIASQHTHLELTNLVIPTLNDSDEEIEMLLEFLQSLGKPVPLHFSRYYPAYRMKIPPTDPEELLKIFQKASRVLPYVYLGNIRNTVGNNTYCPDCHNLLVERNGYRTRLVGIEDHHCNHCGREVDLVGV
ncbi:AmmeMemoRadiSam system radical SAM enzyme [bacterium]|nr:AmmeMemoRadiSam system radical SAM enzyme [bacterium]